MLLYIITNAVLFSLIMTNENIPQALADWMLGNGLGMITFLLAVNVILLLAGNFMEPSSIVLIFAPIMFPVAMALGIHPVPVSYTHLDVYKRQAGTFFLDVVLVQQPEQRNDCSQQQHDAQLGQGENPAQAAGADGGRERKHGGMLNQPSPAGSRIVENHNTDIHNAPRTRLS